MRDILRSTGNHLFMAKQIAEITGDSIERTRSKVLREEIKKRVPFLDYSFLAVLKANAKVSISVHSRDVATVMLEMRDIVLDEVERQMPPILQTLNELMKLQTRAQRFAQIESILQSNLEVVESKDHRGVIDGLTTHEPHILQLYLLVNQLLEDLESAETVTDLPFLAKLVLVREEIRLVGEETELKKAGKFTTQYIYQQLPVAELAFLKELMLLNDSPTRKTALTDAFMGDKRIIQKNTLQTKAEGTRSDTINFKKMHDALTTVKPGRLIDTLSLLEAELGKHETISHKKRVQDIRVESCEILEKIVMGTM